MFGKSQKATADWPVTTQINGGSGSHITGKYVPPGLEKTMMNFYVFCCFFVVIYVADKNGQDWFLASSVTVGVLTAAYYFVWKTHVLLFLGKSVDVKIFPDAIHVRQLFGYKKYSRGVPIEFRVDRHQKALKEQAKEIETNKKQPSTYRQAVEVVMQYGEHRIVIAELPETDMEKARALTMRLGMLNEARSERHGIPAPDGRELIFAAGQAPSSDFGRSPEIR